MCLHSLPDSGKHSNMSASGSFQDLQYAFTRHIRDPEHEPAPVDIEDRRMAIYRRLLFKNIEGFLASSFPVLRKVTPDDRWQALARDYFHRHQARTPLFPRMPQEFLEYLEHERDDPDDPPWMFELAHYEWLETATAIDPREIEMQGIDPQGDLLAGWPVINPLASPVAYQWPVHRISPQYLPDEPPAQPTYLVVYRNHDDKVSFMELNPVSARLLQLIQTQSAHGRKLLQQIATELNHPDPEVVIQGGSETLTALRERSILLGTHCS